MCVSSWRLHAAVEDRQQEVSGKSVDDLCRWAHIRGIEHDEAGDGKRNGEDRHPFAVTTILAVAIIHPRTVDRVEEGIKHTHD